MFTVQQYCTKRAEEESKATVCKHKAGVTHGTSSIIDIQGNQYDFRISFTPGKPAHCVMGFIIGRTGERLRQDEIMMEQVCVSE